jgi:hypothetical protein
MAAVWTIASVGKYGWGVPVPASRPRRVAANENAAASDGLNGTARPATAAVPVARDDAGVRSVVRALDLLTYFDDARPRAQRARPRRRPAQGHGAAPGSDARALRHAVDPPGRPVGRRTGLLRWARLARNMWQLPEPAWEAIRELSDETGETVNVFVRHGLVRVCVAQQEGASASARGADWRRATAVGRRYRLCTAD